MTKLKLKKHLAVLPKEDVMNLVLSLYDASAEAKMYLEMYLKPDYGAALEKYKKIIRNEFFPDRGFLISLHLQLAARQSPTSRS